MHRGARARRAVPLRRLVQVCRPVRARRGRAAAADELVCRAFIYADLPRQDPDDGRVIALADA